MCGFTGYIGDFNRDLLEKMTNAVGHRGPDDFGIWYNDDYTVGLGHRRLAIQDLSSAGHQPMLTYNNRHVIAYNGEIYNFKELREELISLGISFRSQTDTEVLLKGLVHFGKDYLNRLNGIFAFAYYNINDKTLLLARDGMGVKPLYLGKTELGYVFSSEMKSLLLEKSIERDLNEKAIVNYLSFLWSPGQDTMFKSINKILPGEALLFRNGKLENRWSFYDIPFKVTNQVITESDAIDQLDFLLAQSVKRQMVSDANIGAFLSGGLDSSSLCYYASRIVSNLDCFTIQLAANEIEDEGIINDFPYAEKVAKYLGVKLHSISVKSDAVCHLGKMIYHLDEPQADPAILNTLFIAQLAKENNIKVLLSGAGGDDLFTGYRRHYAFDQEKYWSNWPKFMRTGLRLATSNFPISHPLARRIQKAFSYADYTNEQRIASYFLWCPPKTVYSLLNPDRFKSVIEKEILSPLLETVAKMPYNIPKLNKMLYLEQKHFLADHNLNYTDKMTMAHGVETRVPFLDNDLVFFASSLPVQLKQNGRIGKYLLKKTMERHLPKEIIYRPKTGFGAPLKKWLNCELKELVDNALSKDNIEKRGLFNFSEVQKLVKLNREKKIDASYTIFALVCMEIWMEKFLD